MQKAKNLLLLFLSLLVFACQEKSETQKDIKSISADIGNADEINNIDDFDLTLSDDFQDKEFVYLDIVLQDEIGEVGESKEEILVTEETIDITNENKFFILDDAEVLVEIVMMETIDNNEVFIPSYINECPTGLECLDFSFGIFCDPGYLIKAPEIQSICTKPCDVKDENPCSDLLSATCCGNVAPADKMPKYFCVPQDICCQPPNFVFCNGVCCPEGFECGKDGKTCTQKCEPPTPNPCQLKCCPNNYDCKCKDEGGFCVPKDVKVCDCAKKLKCESFDEECIEDESCRALGKICKSLGGEDCPEAPDCYCEPGYVCTHSLPACCPQDASVPCGDYCCPEDNDLLTNEECVPETKEKCKGSGEEYCGKLNPDCQIVCGIGLQCKEKECGCKNDGDQECENGIICSVEKICVGAGKGENNSGCCPKQNSVPCNNYCCPDGTHCESGCGGCVENGKFCCPDGKTPCLNGKVCWSGGSGVCLGSVKQDCLATGFGNYYCGEGEVCANVSDGCCPETNYQGCGDKCCESYETCYEADKGGFCVDEQGGEEYCGNSFKCSSSLKCCYSSSGGLGCIPDGAQCCRELKLGTDMCFCPGAADFCYYCCGPTYIEEIYCVLEGTFACKSPKGYIGYCPKGMVCKLSEDGKKTLYCCDKLGTPTSSPGCYPTPQLNIKATCFKIK